MLLAEKKLRKIIRGILLKEENNNENIKKPDGFDTSLSTNEEILKIIRDHAKGIDFGPGNPIYQKAQGKSPKVGEDGQIPNIIEKIRKVSNGKYDLSVMSLNRGKDYSLNLDALKLYLDFYNKKIEKEPKTGPKQAESYAYQKMIIALRKKAKAKSKETQGQETKKDPQNTQGQSDKKDSTSKTKKKKIASKSKLIGQIQELLNELGYKDYEGKKLDVDRSWGSRTRSATSLMLKTINDKNLFDKLKLLNMKDDALFGKLALKKKGGPGSWNKVALKLITSDAAKKFTPGANKYNAAIFILQSIKALPSEEAPTPPVPDPSSGEPEKAESEIDKKDSKYYIENIYGEQNKVFKKEKAAKVDLGKIPLGAFNKMRTGSTMGKNLFWSTPKTYKKPPNIISWLGSKWKDNHHGNEDVNIYFENYGTNSDIIFTDGTTGCPKDAVQMYRIAIDGSGNANAFIEGYVAVKESQGKIFLMSVEKAKKEGHIKSNKK